MSNQQSKETFGLRLKEAFGQNRNKEIAEILGVSKATITLYTNGHLPPSETLLKISDKTGCNLHWLMTGQGTKWVAQAGQPQSHRAKVIALYNAAGGTGKSTSAVFLAMSLARYGCRTLLMDAADEDDCSLMMFPQIYKVESQTISKRTPKTIRDTPPLIFRTPVRGLDMFIKSKRSRLVLLEQGTESLPVVPSELLLKYSYIIVDTRSRFLMDASDDLINARVLMSAKLLMPGDAHRLPDFARGWLESIESTKEESDEIELLGTFINRAEKLNSFSRKCIAEAQRLLPGKLLNSVIHRTNVLQKLKLSNVGAYTVGPRERIVREYDLLSEEISRHV